MPARVVQHEADHLNGILFVDRLTMVKRQFLAKALKDLASADKLTAERILVVRREAAKEAADKATTVAKAKGLSKETVDELRKEILGVA